jgi:hypothetical protein
MRSGEYSGWDDVIELANDHWSAHVTTSFGPRIIGFHRPGAPNLLFVDPETRGQVRQDKWHLYGGHRLWVAPELQATTYEPDNAPVQVSNQGDSVTFTTPAGRSGLEKSITLVADGEALVLRHQVRNLSQTPQSLAVWALTVMAAGGEALIPQAEFRSHTEDLLPARPLVLWSYTRMDDPRFTFGNRVLRFRQDADRGPCKFGTLVKQGYAAYAKDGDLFLKRFEFRAGQESDYLDFGCNFESFTNQDFLEVESLGPQLNLAPGETTELWETWYLVPGVTVPEDDGACATWLAELAATCPLITRI